MPAARAGIAPALEEESPRNIAGRAHAVNVLTGMPRLWVVLLHRVLFGLTAIFRRSALKKLTTLSFIYFAEWSYMKRVPPKRGRRLGRTQMLFQSNFSGSWSAYLDAFVYVLPTQTWSVWVKCYDFPGTKCATPFKEWARAHDVECLHYWSAYPEASVTEVDAALGLVEAAREFHAKSADLDDAAWRASFDAFLTKNQLKL
jgi:hypothetical protein